MSTVLLLVALGFVVSLIVGLWIRKERRALREFEERYNNPHYLASQQAMQKAYFEQRERQERNACAHHLLKMLEVDIARYQLTDAQIIRRAMEQYESHGAQVMTMQGPVSFGPSIKLTLATEPAFLEWCALHRPTITKERIEKLLVLK